jgi:excreted virulence factor EspC (type VII ESX diderm)
MAGDTLEVNPADLHSHATHVDTVADGLGTAEQAGEAVQVGVDAYGRLCTTVPLLLGWLRDGVIDGIATAEDSLHDSADRLRRVAVGYQQSDEAAVSRIPQAGGR